MSAATDIAVIVALLGSAIIAGTFFAFSSFIMGALARLPAAQGMAAMQSINVVVLNRSFLGAFIGTALLSLVIIGLSAAAWQSSSSPWYVAAAASYFVGTFLVTGSGNVPLNNRLAAANPGDAHAQPLWDRYLERWTRLNTLRTLAAATAMALYLAGLLQRGAG